MTAPTIGRVVQYCLSEADAEAINRRRDDAYLHISEHRENANGVQVHTGNPVRPGEYFPAIVVRVFGQAAPDAPALVNLQVFLDGSDTYWATSHPEGSEPGTWTWPPRV